MATFALFEYLVCLTSARRRLRPLAFRFLWQRFCHQSRNDNFLCILFCFAHFGFILFYLFTVLWWIFLLPNVMSVIIIVLPLDAFVCFLPNNNNNRFRVYGIRLHSMWMSDVHWVCVFIIESIFVVQFLWQFSPCFPFYFFSCYYRADTSHLCDADDVYIFSFTVENSKAQTYVYNAISLILVVRKKNNFLFYLKRCKDFYILIRTSLSLDSHTTPSASRTPFTRQRPFFFPCSDFWIHFTPSMRPYIVSASAVMIT